MFVRGLRQPAVADSLTLGLGLCSVWRCTGASTALHSFQALHSEVTACACSPLRLLLAWPAAQQPTYIPCGITSPGRLQLSDSTHILLSGRDPGPAMPRFATGWSPLDAAAEKYRSYSTRNSWPYGPTKNDPTQPGSISSHPAQQAASSSRVATRAGSGGLVNSVEQLLHHIKHMQGFRDVWEVGASLFMAAQADQCAGWPTTLHMTRTAAAWLSLRRLL